MLEKTEYTIEDLKLMTEEEINELTETEGWVMTKVGTIAKLSPKEYKKACEEFRKNNPHYGDTIF